MKIALLSFEYPPETGFGGIGTYTWHHARGLAKLGHEVHVLAGAKSATPLRTEVCDGVTVHRFWADDILMDAFNAFGKMRFWWTRQRLQNAWSMRQGLAALERQHRFDIIEMPECGAEGALVTRRHDLATVVRLHSPAQLIMPYYDVQPGDIRMCSGIERQALKHAGAITACSRFVGEEVANVIGIRRPMQVITNGLDIEWFDSAGCETDAHSKFGLPRDRAMVLFTGRMENRKGIHLCAEIAAQLLERFDVSLVLAGDDLFGYLKDRILPALAQRRLKGSVYWLGALPNADVRSLVRICDVFLLPSLWENCPYSCLEAMAAGRAVVCADQGGMPELIEDGVNGRLAKAGDASAFVARIEELIEDPVLCARLGRSARATIENRHAHTHVARQALDVYSSAIAGLGGR